MGSGSPGPAVGAPRLSVVIACLDAADVLGVQLAALARQQAPCPWEVILADNGSRDATRDVAQAWSDRLPLRVVDAGVVRGPGPARNVGARAARGEWLAFCDADDEVADDWLQAMARSLERNAFVAGRFEGERLNSARVLRSRRLDQQDGLQWSSPAVGMPHAGAGNLGVRRDVFLAAGGFDARLQHLEDTDLCWRIQRTGVPLVFAPEVVVHVRLRSTLRGMFRQGRSYGRAQADLERRYVVGARPLSATGVDDPPSVALRPLGRRPVALLRAVGGELKGFVAGGGVGRQIWRIGWYVGHHGRVEP